MSRNCTMPPPVFMARLDCRNFVEKNVDISGRDLRDRICLWNYQICTVTLLIALGDRIMDEAGKENKKQPHLVC